MLSAPLSQTAPMPLPRQAGSQGAQLPFLEAHGHKGSNSNRTPSFESHLSRRSFEQQFEQVEEQPAPSSAEGDTVGVPGRTAAESLANPGQGVGQQTLSSGRGQHTAVNTGQQESSRNGPSSTDSTAAQEQREGRAQVEAISPGEPYGEGGKVLGSSQAASESASTSNMSGRLGLIPDEVFQTLGGILRNSGSDQSTHAQKESGSSPLLRASTPVAAHGLDLGQIGSTEASEGENSESNLPKVERPNQASPHPGDLSREGLSGAISSELPSETLQTGHGAAVGQQPSVKPVAVSETPAPAGQEVFRQPSDLAPDEPSRAIAAPGARFGEKPISVNTERAVPHSRTQLGPMEESRVPQSRESSARDQQPQLSDQEARTRVFREVGSDSVVRREVPEVSPLTGLPPNDSASFRAAFGVALPLTPKPVPTPRESNGQPPEQQEARGLGPLSTNTRQANLPRLPHSAAELSIQSQLDGSNTDRLASHGSKLGAPSESSRLPIREAPAKAPQGTREDIHAEFRRLAQLTSSASDNRSVTGRSSHKPPQRALSTQVAAATRGGSNDSRSASVPIPRVPSTQQGNLDRGAAQADRSDTGEPGTQPRQETPSARLMAKTSANENAVDLNTLSKPARSGDRTPSPMVKTAAPVARSEVAAITHTPAEAKASFVLPSQSSAQNVNAGSVQTEAYQGASSTASRVRSIERLVDMAALHRKIDSHQMNLLLSNDRIGRMSVRLVERGGVINTLVRTDSTRASHLFTEGLPSLLESLAQRGLQASNAGAGHFLGAREDAQPQQGGRYRPPRHPHRQNRRGGSDAGRVFHLEFE